MSGRNVCEKCGAERRRVSHPTQKPLALMKWLLNLVAPHGSLVLDPFAGSGTTLVAARDIGLRCIGIEKEPAYAAIAAKRLSQQVFDLKEPE